jgi:hypothetical protein
LQLSRNPAGRKKPTYLTGYSRVDPLRRLSSRSRPGFA